MRTHRSHRTTSRRSTARLKFQWHAAQASLWLLLWIALNHSSQTADLVLGAICAVAATAMVAGASRVAGARFGGRPAWVRHLLPIPGRVVRDTGRVLATLFGGAHRHPGAVHRVRFDPGTNNPRDTGRRALVVAVLSTAPNTIVVSAPEDSGVLYVHTLVPPAPPLGGNDPRWPI